MLVTFSILVTARSNMSISGRRIAEISGSNLARAWISLSCECGVFKVEASVSYLSLDGGVLRSVVSLTECDREASIKRRPWHARGRCAIQTFP